MRFHMGTRVARSLLASALAVGAVMITAGPAQAAVDDGFVLKTTDGCGAVDFVDYGEGQPGGGKNDDYFVIHDYCADGSGVAVYIYDAAFNEYRRYNGNGRAGAAVIWDPLGNIEPRFHFTILVGLTNNINEAPWDWRRSRERDFLSVDG